MLENSHGWFLYQYALYFYLWQKQECIMFFDWIKLWKYQGFDNILDLYTRNRYQGDRGLGSICTAFMKSPSSSSTRFKYFTDSNICRETCFTNSWIFCPLQNLWNKNTNNIPSMKVSSVEYVSHQNCFISFFKNPG